MFKRNKAKFAFLGLTALYLPVVAAAVVIKVIAYAYSFGAQPKKEVYEELAKRFNDKITEDTEFSIIFRDVGES